MPQPAQAPEPAESAAVTLVHEILCLTGLQSMQAAPLLKELLLLITPEHPCQQYETAQEAMKTAWRYSAQYDTHFEDWIKEDVTY